MASLKLISAALFTAAVVTAPAMARHHHVRHIVSDAAVVAPDAAYGTFYANGGYRCVPAPRVGAFAGAPWELSTPCEPAYAPVQAY